MLKVNGPQNIIQLHYTTQENKISERVMPAGFIKNDNPWLKVPGIEYEDKNGRYTHDFSAWMFTTPENRGKALRLIKAAIRKEKTRQDKIFLLLTKVGTFEIDEYDSTIYDLRNVHKAQLMKPVVFLGKDYVGHIFCKPEEKSKAIAQLQQASKEYMNA